VSGIPARPLSSALCEIMSIDVVAKVAGVLGFVISVATFVLTRVERRKRIEIELFSASVLDFSQDEDLQDDSLIRVRFTNIGLLPVILKPRTLSIKNRTKVYTLDRDDYWGMEDFEELMPPTSSRDIGVYLDSVEEALGIASPRSYDEESFNKLYPLVVSVHDHAGKRYSTKVYSYHEVVGEFVT